MRNHKRILVTGSRDWPSEGFLWEVFTRHTMWEYAPVLISGACPTDADAMAEAFFEGQGWQIERYPADWNQYGKRAGYLRNKDMVENADANICLAFIYHNSRGASMTWDMWKETGREGYAYTEADLEL